MSFFIDSVQTRMIKIKNRHQRSYTMSSKLDSTLELHASCNTWFYVRYFHNGLNHNPLSKTLNNK